MIKKCWICGKPILNKRFKFCPDCSLFSKRLHGSGLTRRAIKSIWAYVRRYGYVCFYTGMPLVMNDPHDPWYCVFDHYIPGDDRRIVLTSFLINDMKTELSGEEFLYYVVQLYHFRTKGWAIRKKRLRYWKGFTNEVIFSGPIAQRKICHICGQTYFSASHHAKYCPFCADLLRRMRIKKFPAATIKEVCAYLRRYGFVCYYTGMKLKMNDPRSPWYGVLDHWIPGNPKKVVLTSALFNSMKSDLTEREFWSYIEQLYHHWKKGSRVRRRRPVYWNRLYPLV